MRKGSILATLCVLLIALTACQQGPGTKPETEQEETPTYSSRIFTVRPADFIVAGVPGTRASVAGAEYSVPEITKEAVEKGLVEAYVQDTKVGQGWIGLPFTLTLDVAGGRTISLSLHWGFEVGNAGLVLSGNVTAAEMRPLLDVLQGNRLRVVVGR